MSVNHPSIFIVHGKHPKVLDRIKTFLSELEVTPIVAEEKPSMALPPEDKVEYFMKLCDAVLILATPDEIVRERSKLHRRPRPNVIFEIKMAKGLKPGKIIYMKEKNVEFPSDLIPPTYISFRLSRMDDALIQLIRELKGLGLLKIETWAEQEEIETISLAAHEGAGTLTVRSNKSSYSASETITISGTVPAVLEGVPIAMLVFNPRNTMYAIDQVLPNPDGTFFTTIKVGGKLGIDGIYTVRATYSGQSIQTTFDFRGR